MTTVRPHFASLRTSQKQPGTAVVGLWVLTVAILTGLLSMHAVSTLVPAETFAVAVALPAANHIEHDALAAEGAAAARHIGCLTHHDRDHHDGPCPEHHGHPGPVCQSGAVQAGAAAGVPSLSVDVIATAAESRIRVSPATTAAQAAAGSGCGPPSLTELSISRT